MAYITSGGKAQSPVSAPERSVSSLPPRERRRSSLGDNDMVELAQQGSVGGFRQSTGDELVPYTLRLFGQDY